MKVSLVNALETNIDADHFYEGYRYVFIGVVDIETGEVLKKITIPNDMPGWIASGLAGTPMFMIKDIELGSLQDIGFYVEQTLTAIEKDVKGM